MLKLLPNHKKTVARLLKPCLASYIAMVPSSEPSKTYRRYHNWCQIGQKQDSFMPLKKKNLQLYRGLCSAEYGDMSGKWYNELGSTVELTQTKDGVLGGVYCNQAPDSSTVKEKLVGSMGKGVPATVGFVVNFEDGQFTTSWSGQYFKEAGVDKKEVILTTWIMTANLPDYEEYWESTNVGQDRFTREPQKPKGRKSLAIRHLKDKMK